MDRRRFTPSAEGLEGRALLSLFGSKAVTTNTTVSIQDLPKTYREKQLRIAHLPYYLLQEDPRRFLPPDTIQQLQVNMNEIVSELHAPTTPVVDAFNAELRHLLPQNTLSPTNAKLINHAFGSVLERAGATPEEQANLQNDMNSLAKVDALSIQPSTLAREDYALVLQTTLAIGRPMITPTAPTLKASDGVKINGGRIGLTHNHSPTMVGTYQAGATRTGSIWIQIVDQTGQVLGTAPVDAAGQYSIVLNNLADGTYRLRSRSSDEVGHLSDESNPFTLKVATLVRPRLEAREEARAEVEAQAQGQVIVTPPAGPLGLKS
jgi:hypothetical protein